VARQRQPATGPRAARLRGADGRIVLERVHVSRSFERGNARGLLGREGLPEGEGLLLADPTGTIHTFFMRFPIDAVFLTADLRVLRIAAAVPPWRLARARGARRILELAAGGADRAGIAVGDTLLVEND
jgi:uncharacterized membrane protein (UPF0127 family)